MQKVKLFLLTRKQALFNFTGIASWGVFACLLLLTSCNIPFRSKNPSKLPADAINGPYYQAADYSLRLSGQTSGPDSLTVQYLGCGGLYVQKNGQSFLVDPYFSYIKMLPGLKLNLQRLMWLAVLAQRDVKIKPHLKSIELGYSKVSSQKDYTPPAAILITHGHYDHLLDVPYIFNTKFAGAPAPVIYGNLSTVNLLRDIIDPQHLKNLEPEMQNQHNTGTWILLGNPEAPEHIRFMAIESDHAPHAKSLKLFDGDALHSIGTYPDYLNGTPINQWLEGRTLGLLVDFMKGKDTIAFRMFIQTSACTPTRGLLPAALKQEKAVDLAVLCVASFELADDYPCRLLANLDPQHVYFVHWEDFIFKSYKRILEKPKTIGFSNVRTFIGNIQEIRNRHDLKFRYSLPAPGAKTTIHYSPELKEAFELKPK